VNLSRTVWDVYLAPGEGTPVQKLSIYRRVVFLEAGVISRGGKRAKSLKKGESEQTQGYVLHLTSFLHARVYPLCEKTR